MRRKFIKKWHGKPIKDDGSYTSRQFNSFAKELKTVISQEAERMGITLTNYSAGHYFVSGFLAVRDDAYVYFSYDVPRGELPLDLTKKDACYGFLVRTAKNETDYTGGQNHFTDFAGLFELSEKLLSRELQKKQNVVAA